MYTILIDGQRHSIDAENIQISNGNMYFFADKENTQIKALIPAGKWSLVECSKDKYMKAMTDEEVVEKKEEEIE